MVFLQVGTVFSGVCGHMEASTSRIGTEIVTGPSGTEGSKARAGGILSALNGKEHSSKVTSRDRIIAQVLLFQSQ